MTLRQDEISEDALEEALELLRGRLESAETRRAEADQEVSKLREEETLLAQLLALRRGHRAGQPEAAAPVASVAQRTQGSGSKSGVLKAVQAELLRAGRPLHISDLMRLLTDASVRIPGAGSQANLISCIRRDKRIVRPSRGMYGLATWGLSEMPRAASRRRRRRRPASSGASQP